MAQGHSVTKRNRRQMSHTRGHEGRETQLALRSPEAKDRAFWQEQEVLNGIATMEAEAMNRRAARDRKRKSMRKT